MVFVCGIWIMYRHSLDTENVLRTLVLVVQPRPSWDLDATLKLHFTFNLLELVQLRHHPNIETAITTLMNMMARRHLQTSRMQRNQSS
jgi:hypothetical protein